MFNVRVMKIKQDGKTGYTEVYVRAEQTVGNVTQVGPEKGYNVEAHLIEAHWGGQVNNWLEWVKLEHQKYHGIHKDMSDQLQGMVGKLL